MLTVDDYEVIRRKVKVEGLSQREAARQLGRSRKTVKKALEHSSPPGYRRQTPAACPVIAGVAPIIKAWLTDDRGQPPKQRHTMTWIYQRLVEEHDFRGGYDAVRRYIGKQRLHSGEVYFPLVFEPGEEGQVDWGDGWCYLNGEERKFMLFCVRLAYSTASFVRAYERQDLESVLDGHVHAYEFFDGVPRRQAYDNMKTVVLKVGRGQERTRNKAFRELRSHYLFETRFCNVASGNEKGHVENLVKFAQRNFMTPLPAVTSLAELNAHLLQVCRQDLDRRVKQRGDRTRGELLAEERRRFLPLPATPFEACKRASTFASKEALVRFDNVQYSVPVEHAYVSIELKAFVERVELRTSGECVATHPRRFEPGFCLDYTHYIPLLERKPGGIHNGRPFKGEPWGEDLQRLRRELECRYGDEGTKKFIRVLRLFSRFPISAVQAAVRACVRRSAFSDEAVAAVLNFVPRRRGQVIDLSSRPDLRLEGDGIRPAAIYDGLLGGKEASA